MENKRHPTEIADIFSYRKDDFLKDHKLTPGQMKAFRDIIQCRTSALGGHIEHCNNCGYTRPAYNSCRNRHCPRCQFLKKAMWADKLAAMLPPVKHYHVVFTLPKCLHKLFYINQDKAYNLFFKAATKALSQCALNPSFLGAQTGAVALLHTWGQTLVYHPHIHMMVPAGGLSEDQMEWIPAGNKFFLPVKVLSAVFRGILCRLIEQAVMYGSMRLPEEITDFQSIKKRCYQKKWVVYCEKPFSGINSLIQYLANYTHRVAMTNHRIIQHKNGKVSFWYKDYKRGAISRQITLDDIEFIRRFLQHILPAGFYKIRYLGLLANCNSKAKLTKCFELIDKDTCLPLLEGLNALEIWRYISGRDPLCCPKCNAGKMSREKALPLYNFKPG